MNLLEAKNLNKRFGGVQATSNVSLHVAEGEMLGLFGPNGAGKTTLFNLLAGAFPVDSGEVWLDGHNITALPAYQRAQRGIARTFQVVRPFRELTVEENLLLPLSHQSLRQLMPLGIARKAHMLARAREVLEQVGLADRAGDRAGTLTLGMHKRLEVARALALEPRVLLLDEPLAGLTLAEAQRLLEAISKLRSGRAVILVEHNVRLALPVCDRALVLESGAELASGLPEEIRTNKDVIRAYLGEESDA